MRAFIDTNVLIYSVSTDPRKARAGDVLGQGGVISVQVLIEFTHVAWRKLGHGWGDIAYAVAQFRACLEPVLPLTADTHEAALALARDDGLAFYDALIVASALDSGCDTLYSEDLQHGRHFGDLAIRNPFRD